MSSRNLNSSRPIKYQQKSMAEADFYRSSGKKFSRHGHVFQLKLLMIFMNRGCKNGYQFNLGTEIEGAKAFDDIVFKYKNENNETEYRFVQVKHRLKENEAIQYSHILGGTKEDKKGDFHLQKYFESYLTIKENGKPDGIFPDLKLKDLILYTNIGFDDTELNNKGITLEKLEKDNILNDEQIGTKIPQRYKFKKFPKVEREIFYASEENHQLAKRLIECAVHKKPVDLNNNFFKKYHHALCLESIIDISTKKFHDKFISDEGLSANAKTFRKTFLVAGLQKNENEEEFWMKIKSKVLTLSKTFGQSDKEAENQLPKDRVNDDLIDGFLSLLVFAVHQPNEKQMDAIIKKELRDEFNLLNSTEIDNKFYRYMWEWMTESHGRFLSEQNMKHFFEKSKNQMQKLKIIGITSDNEEKNLNNGDFYEDVSEIEDHLKSEECVIQIVAPECTSLIFIKFVQALDNRQIDSFAATSMKHLIANQEKFLAVFDSDECFTLVIEWESERMPKEQSQTIKKKAERLFQAMDSKIKPEKKQKLILITSTDGELKQVSSRFSLPFKSVNADKIDFCDLTDLAKARILSKSVNFQESRITLKNLLENEMNIISNGFLNKLINEEDIIIGKRVGNLEEIEFYYIERSFQQIQMTIEEIFSRKNNEDIFVIDGTNKMELLQILTKEKICEFGDNEYRNKICNIITVQNYAQFLEACKYLSGKNIHLFIKTLDKFEWIQSFGIPFSIVCENDLIIRANEKNTVIVGEPGIGKTTVFKRIASKMKQKYPNCWVIFISLGECKSQLEKHDLQTADNVIKFIIATQQLEKQIEQRLLKTRIMFSGKTVLILDGFDDVDSSMHAKIKLMLNSLKTTKLTSVWLSARLQFQDGFIDLADSLSKHSYILISFSIENYKTFLQAYWKRHLQIRNTIKCIDETRLRFYVESLLRQFIESTKFQANEILVNPLHAHMLAEVYQEDVERFLLSDTADWQLKISAINVPNSIIPIQPIGQIVCKTEFNLLELYKQFVKNKFKLCIPEKMSLDDEVMNEMFDVYTVDMAKRHEIIALNMLFSGRTKEIFNIEHAESVSVAMKKIGIIQTINGENKFLHRSFVDYFAAEKIAKCIKMHVSNEKKYDKLFQILSNIILNESTEMLRQFLDIILANDSEIHVAVLHGDDEKFKNIITQNPEKISSRDLLGRTPLHYACQYNRIHMGDYLISNDPQCINATDKFNLSPVCYALASASYTLLKLLLEKGKNNDKFLISLKQMLKIFGWRRRNSSQNAQKLSQFATDEQKDAIFSDSNYDKLFMDAVETFQYKSFPVFFNFANKARQKEMLLQDNCKIIKKWLNENPALILTTLNMCIDETIKGEIKDQICTLGEYKNEFRKLRSSNELENPNLLIFVQLINKRQFNIFWTAEEYAKYINHWILKNAPAVVYTLLNIYNPEGQLAHLKYVEYFDALILNHYFFWAIQLLQCFQTKQQKEIVQKTKWKLKVKESFLANDIMNFHLLFVNLKLPQLRKEILKRIDYINAFTEAVKKNDINKLLMLSWCTDFECAELTKALSDEHYIKLFHQNIKMFEDLFILVHFSANREREDVFKSTACPDYIQEKIQNREFLNLPKESINEEKILEAFISKKILTDLPINQSWSIWGKLLYTLIKNIKFPPKPLTIWL